MENLACKATAAMAFRTLLAQTGTDSQTIEYVLNSGEEAVGDRYQRGGGNLAKAVAEMQGARWRPALISKASAVARSTRWPWPGVDQLADVSAGRGHRRMLARQTGHEISGHFSTISRSWKMCWRA